MLSCNTSSDRLPIHLSRAMSDGPHRQDDHDDRQRPRPGSLRRAVGTLRDEHGHQREYAAITRSSSTRTVRMEEVSRFPSQAEVCDDFRDHF